MPQGYSAIEKRLEDLHSFFSGVSAKDVRLGPRSDERRFFAFVRGEPGGVEGADSERGLLSILLPLPVTHGCVQRSTEVIRLRG